MGINGIVRGGENPPLDRGIRRGQYSTRKKHVAREEGGAGSATVALLETFGLADAGRRAAPTAPGAIRRRLGWRAFTVAVGTAGHDGSRTVRRLNLSGEPAIQQVILYAAISCDSLKV